jgi:hypothetical protein
MKAGVDNEHVVGRLVGSHFGYAAEDLADIRGGGNGDRSGGVDVDP